MLYDHHCLTTAPLVNHDAAARAFDVRHHHRR